MKKREIWTAIKNIMDLQGDMNEKIKFIIANGTYEQYCLCTKAMIKSKYHKKRLESFSQIEHTDGLFTPALFPSLTMSRGYTEENFYKDVEFMLAFMTANREQVLSFLRLKNAFEHDYLIGNYEKALKTLNDIYVLTGLSFWFIEAKLLLLNEIDYNKYCHFYRKARDGCTNDLFREYIRSLKRKAHMRTNGKEYDDFFKKHITAFESSCLDTQSAEVFRTYFWFSSYQCSQLKGSAIKQLLCCALCHLSFVDTFLLMDKMITLLMAANPNDKNRALYERFRYAFTVDDEDRGAQYHDLKRLLCENRLQECIGRCEALLNENAQHFEVLDIYVKALLIIGKQPDGNRPLDAITNILISCYLKWDGTNYASSYIDKCDQYLKAWDNFSGFYELFSIVINTMHPYKDENRVFYIMKLLKRPYGNSEAILVGQSGAGGLGDLYSCEWGRDFYSMYEEGCGIRTDAVGKRLNDIYKGCYIQFDLKNLGNTERILYQEAVSIAFAKCVDEGDCLEAIHLYMQTYFIGMFLVMKLDIGALNAELVESACTPLLGDIDFFIYASINDLNRNFPTETSQCVIDSFAEILLRNHINKPSELIRNEQDKDNPHYFMFFDLCCNKILEESPCDLYGEDLYEEQIKLLEYLYQASGRQDYQEKLREVRGKYDYCVLRNTDSQDENAIEKINLEWISLEFNNNIISEYDSLQGKTASQICESESLFNDFKRMLIRCKKEYVCKINSQMGTTIRHSVLDTEIVQILTKHNLFIPKCDEEELERRIASNDRIQFYDYENQKVVSRIIQNNCLKLLQGVEEVKTYIFFTNDNCEAEGYHTSAYMSTKDIKEQLAQCVSFDGGAKFIQEIQNCLNRVIKNRVARMREKIESKLAEIISSYLKDLKAGFSEENLPLEGMAELKKDFEEAVLSIGEWFQIAENSDKTFDLVEYLKKRSEKFPEITFAHDENPCFLGLTVINTIGTILINLISNIQRHAGFIMLPRARGKIMICADDNEEKIVIEATNCIEKGDGRRSLAQKIEEINAIMTNLESDKDFLERQMEKVAAQGDNHGLGLIRIGSMLQQNYRDSTIFAECVDNVFRIRISFVYGRDNDENTAD